MDRGRGKRSGKALVGKPLPNQWRTIRGENCHFPRFSRLISGTNILELQLDLQRCPSNGRVSSVITPSRCAWRPPYKLYLSRIFPGDTQRKCPHITTRSGLTTLMQHVSRKYVDEGFDCLTTVTGLWWWDVPTHFVFSWAGLQKVLRKVAAKIELEKE